MPLSFNNQLNNFRIKLFILIAVILFVLFISTKFNNSSEPSVVNTGQVINNNNEQAQTIDVVKKFSPAVVSIIVTAEVPKYEQCESEDEFAPGVCQTGTELVRISAGSGFILSPDGYIATNKHVVENEKASYVVVLNDKVNKNKKYPVKLISRDPNNDIAILKIDAENLVYVNFADSNKLEVGQTAIAIGYSLGEFDNTVSKGVVSGLARSLNTSGERLKGLIQTDAAINLGNSGGPLLDINGNVLGMNTAVLEAQSIGFAIPGNNVKTDFEEVKISGGIKSIPIAFLGVRFIPITPEFKKNSDLPFDYGMLVVRGKTISDVAVMPGSPADKAGIKENDIILEINGKQLDENYMLSDALDNQKPGDRILIKIYQKGNIKDFNLVLGKK